MKYILITLFIFPYISFGLSCDRAEKVADYLSMDGKKFMEAYRNHKAAGNKDELRVAIGDVSQARKMAYTFPPLKDLGFPPIGKNWEPFVVSMEKSSLYGMKSGRKFTNVNGDIATIRVDYDPVKGGHYNIEVMKRTHKGKESFKLSIEFDCAGKPCTPDQIKSIAKKIN